MNEYIANEKIGYLFETNSKKININNIFNEKIIEQFIQKKNMRSG